MIFYRLFEKANIDESLTSLLKSEYRDILTEILADKPLNGPICTFFSDFFRKFFKRPEKSEYVRYLRRNVDNFNLYVDLIKSEIRYNAIIGYSAIKHYLEIYGLYLASDCEKNEELNKVINSVLESQEPVIEMLRNYVLKSMASYYGGNANSLHNFDYAGLGINWVNNKLFENNDNSLGIEPNLPEFEKLNKEYNLFFVSLLSDDSDEMLIKLKTLIFNSQTKHDLKFILIQFFINKIWLSYSNPKFLSSIHTATFSNFSNFFFE
jgi:hypothetical protein